MKNTTTYTGSWSANNNNTYSYGYTDTNKKRLAKKMREIAEGNVFVGNTARWSVTELIDGIPAQEPILRGTVRK